ncbi:UNVERIFIED_CONTAM: Lysine-specific demethylase 2A [Gekko kuhli]
MWLLSVPRSRSWYLGQAGSMVRAVVTGVTLVVGTVVTGTMVTEVWSPGCNKLTDQTLLYLRRISNVTLIDLRGCKQITRKACEHFISDLSINSLYCLSDEKLIQKIS